MRRSIDKDTADTVRIVIDWAQWLGTAGIASSTWEASSNSLGLTNSTSTTDQATVYVSGGMLNAEYWVKNTITTDETPARIESRSVQVRLVRKVA